MSLKIYNSLTREKETFVPLEEGKVRMYVCGPTVYNYIHIGNARPFIFFDVVRRYLEQIGYDVTYVQNFTDVDDKLIRKAGELGWTVPEVADKFIEAYFEDAHGLKIRDADYHPRVTGTIPEIIAFISELIEKGYAYPKEGDVYFRTARFRDYGKLSHQNLDELHYGIRVEVDARKDDPRDFVLWKGAKPGEICWDSPWGAGRPGWHIECSTMAKRYLGKTIDIHGGGIDLQFPHHECELAQSEAHNDTTFARYWMHNAFINMNNEKMSKSEGNVVNAHEMLKRHSPEAIRFFMLSAHYRMPLNYSEEVLVQATGSLNRIENCLANLKHRLEASVPCAPDAAFAARIKDILDFYHAKMQDDFNTPDALTAVFDLVSAANQYLQQDRVDADDVRMALEAFHEIDRVLGILQTEAEGLLDEEVERLILERTEARKSKNWARADEIRDLLQERGIILEDTPQGIRWRRK